MCLITLGLPEKYDLIINHFSVGFWDILLACLNFMVLHQIYGSKQLSLPHTQVFKSFFLLWPCLWLIFLAFITRKIDAFTILTTSLFLKSIDEGSIEMFGYFEGVK